MARPEKNTVDYFPFLIKKGKKMFYIENKFKNDGYAVWVKLLCELASTNYHYLHLKEDVNVMYLSSVCLVEEDLLLEIIEDLVKLGEFNKQLWEAERILFNEKLIDSVQDAYKKRKNKIINLPDLISHLKGLGVLKQDFRVPKGGDNPQSKVKESKEEESKLKKSVEYVVDFLNKTANKNYRSDNEVTILLISKLIEDGYSGDDFKRVITTKTKEWKGTANDKYLRPETLFSKKFEGYLNQDPNVSVQRAANFPDGYDPIFVEQKCKDPKVLMAYWKHIRKNGWRQKNSRWYSPDYVAAHPEMFNQNSK